MAVNQQDQMPVLLFKQRKKDLILLSLTEDDRDILSEVLNRELDSYLEFYRGDQKINQILCGLVDHF